MSGTGKGSVTEAGGFRAEADKVNLEQSACGPQVQVTSGSGLGRKMTRAAWNGLSPAPVGHCLIGIWASYGQAPAP